MHSPVYLKSQCQIVLCIDDTLAEQLAKLPVVIFGDWHILSGNGWADASDY
jgi:hypothetical protein